MKKSVYFLLALVLAYAWLPEGSLQQWLGQAPDAAQSSSESGQRLLQAYRQRESKLQIRGEGIVDTILKDDLKGSRHQRFILRLDSGLTVLVAHNIDLAPRIDGLRQGDRVAFNGVYEWNDKGGVIHWTHHDPRGRHIPGWLEHQGRVYQ